MDFRHHYQRGERREAEQVAYQWDLGHVAEIYVPANGTYVINYCMSGDTNTDDYYVDSISAASDGGYEVLAHVPNTFFERSGELRVYLVGTDENMTVTTYEGFITIRDRLQPEDYIDDDPDNGATRIVDVAKEYAETSEAWAVGTKDGTDVPSTADQYHNNAKYYADDAAASASAAYSGSGLAAKNSIASDFSSSTAYTAGQYVYYNNTLYCFTADHAAGAWTGSDATAVTAGGQLTDLKNALNIINPTADITWELGKSINGSGDVVTNNYTALSNDIQCDPGDFFVTTSPTVDANNKFLVYYIVQYNGDTFISRTEFTSSIRSIVIGDTTTKIRVVFGRYGSSQTTITQQDITTYVAIKFARKAASKADTNLQFRNTFLNKYTDIGTGINDITENSFVFSPEGTANNPTTTGGYFIQTILYNTSGTAAMQIAYKYDVGLCYYRRKVNGSWRSWKLNSAPANPTSPLYYAFGDSLTYGAVWTPKEESPYYQITQAGLINQIPTRIANAIGASNSFANKGVGGAYFVGTGTNKIITAIQNQDLSDAKIITIAGGRNDSENTLGDKTATSGDGTICGAIREILDYVTTNYKKLQIVWIGVTPNTSNNATVFTRVFAGGWSLNSFDEKVAELCAEYSVPYVNWKMCTYIRHWADYSGAAQVYSHPNNEESYLQMGNYIAGQVAQYYRG